jgi:hypothetical protein
VRACVPAQHNILGRMRPLSPSGSSTSTNTRSRYHPQHPGSKLQPAAAAAAAPSHLRSARHSTGRPSATVPQPASNNNNKPPPRRSLPPPSTTTSKLPAASASTRPPLRPADRNQNVLALTASRSTIKSVFSMPPPPSDRPRQPQLAARAAARPPLTPKVAAAPKGPPVVTPLARRTQTQPADTSASVTTPTASYLGHNINITPRSGPRQSRVDSANSTPNTTPNPERTTDPWDDARSSAGSFAASALSYDGARQSSSTDLGLESAESKFFYASNARNPPQPANSRPASLVQKPSTFFYANSTSANSSRRASPPTSNPALSPPVLASPAEQSSSSKFFYANGTPDVSLKPGLPISSSTSTVSSSSRLPAKRPGTSHSVTGALSAGPSIPSRPVSPIKTMSTPSLQTQKNHLAPLAQPLRSAQVTSPPTLPPPIPSPTTTQKRQVTIDTSHQSFRGHSRTNSIPATEPARPTITSSSPEPCSPPQSPGLSVAFSQPAMTMASLLQAADDLTTDEGESKDGESPSELQSPTKSSYSNDTVSELVANARRERKVQDLEITNASLEAINRTLERQLRKQTAELRRYRRLSRTGRISLASVASSRVTSDAFSEPPGGLSDVDEDEYTEEEDPDSLDETDISDSDETSADASSPSARMNARRQRDEKRLQLDLTKHQELLIDSQKMNQSLKRCLHWSEMLIKEGNKALAYSVRVSDVELGGQVLAPLDEDDEDEDEEDTAPTADATHQSPTTGLEPPWAKGPQDRDSGIELPVEGVDPR